MWVTRFNLSGELKYSHPSCYFSSKYFIEKSNWDGRQIQNGTQSHYLRPMAWGLIFCGRNVHTTSETDFTLNTCWNRLSKEQTDKSLKSRSKLNGFIWSFPYIPLWAFSASFLHCALWFLSLAFVTCGRIGLGGRTWQVMKETGCVQRKE